MEHQMPLLSIVTPTYNRCSLLKRCYASLRHQTCRNFEWIIIDDGSTDDTASVASAFESDLFPICYHQKSNGGKHTALNASHQFIRGKYVLILDSDDFLTENAVEEIADAWAQYDADQRIGIVIFLKGVSKDLPVCTVRDFDVPVSVMGYPRIVLKSTDCCEILRADLFKQYPFPEFEGERFIAESALWARIGFTHQCVYRNSVVYLCEYLEGGLTKAGRSLRIRNPKGGMFVADLRMDSSNRFRDRVKNGILYQCYGRFADISWINRMKQSRSPLLAAVLSPAGAALYIWWNRRYVDKPRK